MADNHINFRLGSSFDGEGFNAAQKAIDSNKKEINAARAGLGDLTKAFVKVHPAIGEASGAIRGFTQAFVTGGIVGGVIQLAITGISKAVEFCQDMFAKAEERVKKFNEHASENLANFATSAVERFKKIGEQLHQLTESAKAFTNAINQVVDADTNEKVYQIAVDKLQKITDDMTDRERAIIEAQADLETAIVKQTATLTKASAALDNAVAARNEAEQRVKDATLANAQAQSALKIAAYDSKMSEEQYKAIRDTAKQAADELRKAEIDLKNAETNAARAAEDEAEATRKLNLAKLEGERKIADATKKRQQEIEDLAKKEREAAEKKIEADKKAAEKAEKEATEWGNFMIQQRNKLEEALGAPKSVGEILDEFDRILKDGAEAILEDEESEKKTGKGKTDKPADGGKGGEGGKGGDAVIPNPLNVNVQNPGAFGQAGNQAIAPFKEVQNEQRKLAREQRNMISELNGKLGGEMTNFFRLLGTPDSARSDLEKAFVSHYLRDVIPTMTNQLGTEMTAKFLMDQASHVLMKKDLQELFSSEERVKTLLEGVKGNTSGITSMATQIQAAVQELRNVVVL